MTIFTTNWRDRAARLWRNTITRYIVSGVLLLVIVLLAFSLFKKEEQPKTPEIAKTELNPRIGDALPPDVNQDYSQGQPQVPPVGQVASDTTNVDQLNMVAPHTGVDDDEPVAYSNEELKFAATLPPGTQVQESKTEIAFSSKSGQRYYTVSVSPAGKETLQTIAAQLQNSSSVKNVSSTTFSGIEAVSFTTGSQKGFAIIIGGKVFYLIGNQYLETFKTI